VLWFFNKPVFAIAFVIFTGSLVGPAGNRLKRVPAVLDEVPSCWTIFSPGTSLDASDEILDQVDTIVMHHPDWLLYASYRYKHGFEHSMASGVIPSKRG